VTDLPEAAPPDHFDEYLLVLLWSARNRVELAEAEADRLQRQHLGHLEAMCGAGHLLVAGPLFDQRNHRLRGICIYRPDHTTKTRQLANSDPAVKAGQLEIEIMGWRTRPGALQLRRNT
jgi:uncharacterized protein